MQLYNARIRNQAASVLNTLPLRQKIGQMVQFNARNLNILQNKYSDEEIAERFPFGSFFSGFDIIGLVGKRLANENNQRDYEKFTRLPLIITGDLENGAGTELLPNPTVLGATDDPELAYKFGRVIAQRGRYYGFHWTFAPVADVVQNWLAPAVGVRALGTDPGKVAVMVENIIRGMKDYGLMSTAKHFPGDGYDFRNQHLGVASCDLNRAEWNKIYGSVFQRAIDAGTNAIMPGHLALPCVDKRKFPAVLSKPILTGLLREEMGFDGVLVSDALYMGGFVSFRSYEKRMITMINAGIDVMLWPEEDIFDIVEKAVEWGDIPVERINEAARRQLEMKVAAGLIGSEQVPEVADAPDYDDVAREIAERGTVLVRDRKNLFPLDSEKVKNILLYAVDYPESPSCDPQDKRIKYVVKGLQEHGAKVTVRPVKNCLDLLELERSGARYDAVIFIFTQKPYYTSRAEGMALEAVWMSSNTRYHDPIVVSFYVPYIITENPCSTATFINACSDCPASQRAVVRLLYGEIPFRGKNQLDMQADDSAHNEWDKISYKSYK